MKMDERILKEKMKTYKYIWDNFISDENYYISIKNATKHKCSKQRKKRIAKYYLLNQDAIKPKIIAYANNFKNKSHKSLEIYDGINRKKRKIIVPSMDEQIVHHMLINSTKHIWMKSMYEHSYGSIPGRGPHKAKKYIERWIKNDRYNTRYCLKMDIKKFFDSIPHNILKHKLSLIIKDEKILSIFNEIIDVNSVGIPLGFYTSQWLANWYLEDLDHYIKESLHAIYYVRYMDDMVIFGHNKCDLHHMRYMISKYLNDNLGLYMKENWQVYRFNYISNYDEEFGRDLDFMGFRFYSNRTGIRKSLMYKMSRKSKRISKKDHKTVYDCRQMISYYGWIKHTNTYNMYKKWIKPNISFRRLRKIESNYNKYLLNKENIYGMENQ